MKLFDTDSPIIMVLNRIADLMWLNILTMICCIPIVTAGASLTAMHYVALKLVRNEEGYITKGFFKSFKDNFKQATVIWLLLLLAIIVIAGDFLIISKSGIEFHTVFIVIIMLAAIALLFVATYVFPVLAKFENTVKETIKNAFLMSILQFPKTITMIVLGVMPTILAMLSYNIWPIVFLFGLSVPAWLSAMVYNRFFQKLENQILIGNSEGDMVSDEETKE